MNEKNKLSSIKESVERLANMSMEDIYKAGVGIFSDNFWQSSLPTYIENWPKGLQELSIPSIRIKLSVNEARALGSNIAELGESFSEKRQSIENIIDRISCELFIKDINYKKFYFVRMGSRSPKDSYYIYENGNKASNTIDVIKILTSASERIYEDLHLAIKNNYEPSIYLREWCEEIKAVPSNEFRCFMVNKKLVGISQYNYYETYKDIKSNKGCIIRLIKRFFKTFVNIIHLNSCVFDVFVNVYFKKVILIEINPLHPLTNPCLFDGRKFKNNFLYNKAFIESVKI